MAQIRNYLVVALVVFVGCSATQSVSNTEWKSPLYRQHPLVGRIWSSADADFIDESELLANISNAKYLLLGEKHDNPDHHRLQLQVLNRLIRQHQVASVAFEMLNSEAQNRLDTIQTQHFTSLDDMKTYLQWDEIGWDWNFYGPLVQAGYQEKLDLLAANIDDTTMRQVYGGEFDQAIAQSVSRQVLDKLNLDIDESHCGLLPESQFPAMVRVQQSRDNQMATTLIAGAHKAGGNGVNILIAGNYHARKDLGVPNYLLRQQNELRAGDIVSLSFSEVDPAAQNPAEYQQQFTDQQAYDYIWFTPAISDEDYCASLQKEQ